MPCPENIIPFKKGDPRINRKGRPKLPDLRGVMAEILAEKKDGKSALLTIIAKLKQLAASGNIKAAEVLLSRAYGLPKQHLECTGKDGGDIERKIIIEVKTPEQLNSINKFLTNGQAKLNE